MRIFKPVLLSVLVLGVTSPRALSADRPNIVFIIADDLGAQDAGFMGNSDVRTPALDGLAARSVVLDRAFVASPTCAPSRGALLSGLMPFRNGAEPNHSLVRDDVKQLPHYFKELGYEVASIGKITHGSDRRAGFDYDNRNLSLENSGIVFEYLSHRTEAKPLLLMVGIKDPHVPWPKKAFPYYNPNTLRVDKRLVDTPETRIELARYYSDVERMDRQLAATLAAVEHHLGPGTVLFFTSDHGAQLPYGKWNNYDYSVQAPILVCWPGVVEAGQRLSALISFVDILPTLIEIAGGDPPPSGYGKGEIDGRSFVPVLRGEAEQHREFVFSTNASSAHHTYPLRSVRSDRYRYVLNVYPELHFSTQTDHNPKSESHGMWRSWIRRAQQDPRVAEKIHRYHHRPKEELYDLRDDPNEQRNLVGDAVHSEALERHRQTLQDWIQQSGDVLKEYGNPMQVLLPVEWDGR